MNRSLVVTMLTLPVVGLSLASSQAAAQQYCPGYCCPQYSGYYLEPTAAYPSAPVYYAPTATMSAPAATSARPVSPVTYRLTSTQAQAAQPVQAAPAAAPQTTYVYSQCCCERCRRQREGGLNRVFRGLWDIEQRKNEFLYDVFFGN